MTRLNVCTAGHPGISFYFIVSGSVLVQVAEKDKITGTVTKQVPFET